MTADEIRVQIAKWQAAENAVMSNKSYSVDGLTVTKQDASVIHERLVYWNGRLAALLLRGGSSFGVSRVRFSDGCRYR